jgi:mRNA (guanine-N7-)-methyltransferase
MLQFSKSEYENLLNILSLSLSERYSELEAVFKPRKSNQPFTRSDFENIFKRLKTLGLKETEEPEQLDIRINSDNRTESNVRITINSVGSIKEYCDKNDINLLENQSTIRFMKKNRFSIKKSTGRDYIKSLYLNNYNFKVNLNHEQSCREKDIETIKKDFLKKNKSFRLKKRYSFVTKDKLFRFDLSIIKTSKTNPKTGDYIYARDLQSSGTLDNVEFYEFEIEFIGFQKMKKIDEDRKMEMIINSFIPNIGIVLQVLRNTYYLISNTEERRVLLEYCNLITGNRISSDEIYNKQNFIGPKNVSLEKMNIFEIDEDFTGFNIRKDYCVTEKADGERHLCFISKTGNIYLINNRLQIIYTGARADNYSNSVLDGELITKTKNGNTIFRYLIFDLYFVQGQDIRDRQLNRTEYDISQKIKISRLEILNNLVKDTKLFDINQKIIEEDNYEEGEIEEDKQKDEIIFSWREKEFYYGDIGIIGNKIFKECKILMEKINSGAFSYHTDGLIFTPIKLPVGGYVEGVSVENTGITWNACFKWKPPHENTIDFLVSVLKEKNKNDVYHDKINYKLEKDKYGNNNLVKYKTLILKTGYSPTKNDKINPCILINEGKEYIERKREYISKEFIPQNPSDEEAYFANIELKTDSKGQERMLCYKTGDEIEDNTIVEMSYDITEKQGFRWKPRNVRYDKTMESRLGYTQFGNDFNTAQSIWSSYHNPITEENIITGQNIEIEEYDTDIYYSRLIERGKSFTKPLLDFHNLYVKSTLIETVGDLAGINSDMIDLACGKAGDLHKWINAKLNFVLGIDISKDNIENSKDGACVRYYQTKEKYKRMDKLDEIPDMIFSAGDTSKSINNGDCTTDPTYKQLLKVLFANEEIHKDKLSENMQKLWGKANNKFEICSIQFALHYYFKDIETLRGVLKNISDNTKIGGYFIGTCFDGKTIFEKLKGLKKGESIEGNLDRKRIWKIKKNYENKTFPDDISSIGYPILVYMETINQMFTEYLVNFDLLTILMKEYGFELESNENLSEYNIKSTGLFSELFNNMIKSGKEYKEAAKMTQKEKEISFINRYFIFKKISKENLIDKPKEKKTKKKKKIVVKNDE